MGIASRNLQRFVARLVALMFVMTPVPALANVGPPPTSVGQIVGEPIGIKDITIARETLVIDLRGLADPLPQAEAVRRAKNNSKMGADNAALMTGLAQVEAVYHLHNRGAEKKLDLLFASGSEQLSDFQVWLGDQPVACTYPRDTKLPSSWQPPKQTPGIGNQKHLDYPSKHVTPISFTVIIPPGPHDLRVRYAAAAAMQYSGDTTVYRQFIYVLAPARSWAGFGGLDVTIHLPKNWRAACTPAFNREGDTLTGNFAELPADAIALTAQAPEGMAYRLLYYGSLGLFGLAGFGGAVMCNWAGRSKGRRLASPAQPHPSWLQRHAWPKSIGLGVLWGLAVLGTGLFAAFVPDWALPAGQTIQYGYGEVFATIGVLILSAIALPAGFLGAQLSALVAYRRANRGLRIEG